MFSRLSPLLAALLACGLLAAGCGDDDGDNAAPAKEQKTSAPDGAVKDAVASCKRAVKAAPQISDDTKKELEDICDEADDGDEQSIRDATRKACKKIAEETLPTEVGREQAVDACEEAVK